MNDPDSRSSPIAHAAESTQNPSLKTGMTPLRLLAALAAIAFAFGSHAAAPAQEPDPAHLRPGQFIWHPEVAPEGPVVVIISIDEQRAYVYRNGVAIGLTTISSGKKGHETPPGVFTILERERVHYSNKYDNAPMPFMERLTWDGVALHGGSLPGYPASHGCVRLPKAFAEKLYEITHRGQTVVVANSRVAPASVVHPAVLAPVSTSGQSVDVVSAPGIGWDESAAPEGPISIIVSLRDRNVHVLRNGVRIGSSPLDVAGDFKLNGSLLFVMGEGFDDSPSPLDPSRPRHRWTVYPIAGADASLTMDDLAAKLHVPDGFARHLYPVLAPGTTVIVTNLPAVREGVVQTVLDSVAPRK